MNLMFRKNFEKSGGGGGGGGGGGISSGGGIGGGLVEGISSYSSNTVKSGGIGGGAGTAVRRLRTDFNTGSTGIGGGSGGGYYPMTSMDYEHQSNVPAYRTHLLFGPHAGTNANDNDYGERFGPGNRRTSSSAGPHLIKWGGNQGNQPPQAAQRRKQSGLNKEIVTVNDGQLTPTNASRQVSFHGNRQGLLVQGNSPARSEPITLATLDRDCFIIPLASLERFLPAGVPNVPSADKKRPGSPLSVLEVEDPKQCILAHFMTQLEPLEPLVESPVSRPLVLQRDTAAELVSELAPSASQSILLTNMERNADFPFITYYVVNKQKTDPIDFYQEVQCAALKKFDPRDLRYAANHNLDLFNEVATIARPPLEPTGGRPPIPSTGYIVSIFKVFEGDDGLKFEQNWLYWTGARMMYRYLPKSVGLRRITLHKSMSQGDKTYLLICECSQLQENLSAAAILLPALRARLCGYVGLYRPLRQGLHITTSDKL